MVNVNDLQKFLKKEMLNNGDVLEFADEGEINEVDFSKAKNGSDIKEVFQIGLRLPDKKVKIATVNKTSLELIKKAFGSDSEKWVGKCVKANIVKQLSFGEMTDVLILVPITE